MLKEKEIHWIWYMSLYLTRIYHIFWILFFSLLVIIFIIILSFLKLTFFINICKTKEILLQNSGNKFNSKILLQVFIKTPKF